MSDLAYSAFFTHDKAGVKVLHTTPPRLLEVVRQVQADGYVTCLDLVGVDYLVHPDRNDLPPEIEPQRFEIMVVLLKHEPPERLRIRVQVSEQNLQVSTLFDIYPSVEAMEREVFDMFGIKFTDHPNLERILMPEDWEGRPLRKDFSINAVPVQFTTNKPTGIKQTET